MRILPVLIAVLSVNITVTPSKEPIWRNKPCMVQTPTEKLLGWSSYRQQLIYHEYKTYRCL